MKTYDDVKIPNSSYEIGLTRVLDKKIKEIRGYITDEFDNLTFKLTRIEFEDGTFLGCEGEHDFPYLVDWGRKDSPEHCEFSNEILESIYQSDPDK
jgi:hypothetical protein